MRGSIGEFLFFSEDHGLHLMLRTAAAVSASVAGPDKKDTPPTGLGCSPGVNLVLWTLLSR